MRAFLFALLAAPLILVVPSAHAEPVHVDVGVLLISFGNYDFAKGTYQMDFYLWMQWNETQAGPGFSPAGFEFMNGRATARDLLSNTTVEGGQRELFYRVNANLYAEPYFQQYPYDVQRLHILLEDTTHTTDQLVYEPLADESGPDESVRVAGWRIQGDELRTETKEYSFGEEYSRLAFDLTIRREPVSTSLKTFLPPLAFMVVSGLSFFFGLGKSAQRVGLGTGTLISAVLFHVSQTVSLPPIATLMLFDKVMISVYAFLAASLIVTTLLVLAEDHRVAPERSRRINRLGALATVLLPFVVFLLLLAF